MAESVWALLGRTVLEGLPLTLLLAFLPLALSILPALGLARLRERRRPVAGRLAAAYVTFFRSVPIVLQILFIYSWLPSALASLMPDERSRAFVFSIGPLWYALFILTLNATALTAEVFRGALTAVPPGQAEAARAAGFSSRRAFFQVILPQTWTLALPNLANAAVVMIRQSALAFLMTVPEMTSKARQAAGLTFAYVESYAVLLAFYIAVCFLSDRLFDLWRSRRGRYLDRDASPRAAFSAFAGGRDER